MWITDFNPTRTSTTQEFALGTIGAVFAGGAFKVYIYVQYTEGSGALDVVAGDVVYYTDDTGYGANTVLADASDASGAEIGAGVITTTITATGTYCWIQIKGPATLAVTIGGSAGDGDPLTAVGAADKALTKAAEADSAATYKFVCAVAVDADAGEIICDFPF